MLAVAEVARTDHRCRRGGARDDLGNRDRPRDPRPAVDPLEDVLRLPDDLRRCAEHQRLPGLPRPARAHCPAERRRGATGHARRTRARLCQIRERSVFARKNYFYPDLPKGYQISQFDKPLAEHGTVMIESPERGPIEIRITRLHLEEDAGKSLHDRIPGADGGRPEPRRDAARRDRQRSRHALAGRGACVPDHGAAAADLCRRQRVLDGEGLAPRRREPLGAAPRRSARHQDRGEEHELVRQRRARARGGAHAADRDAGARRDASRRSRSPSTPPPAR